MRQSLWVLMMFLGVEWVMHESVHAQAFSSGSTGALGALNATTNQTLPLPADGVLNYTTITVAAGVTVQFTANALNTPITMLATGDVTINGTIALNGQAGAGGSSSGAAVLAGGNGGPGGYRGGNGGSRGATNNTGAGGQGPGGGNVAVTAFGVWGVPGYSAVVNLLPLFGGSGGGGAVGNGTYSGSSGGGGGGAIVIGSTTQITISSTGAITALGGDGGVGQQGCGTSYGGGGSGGGIRLVAPKITNLGNLQATGGSTACSPATVNAAGRIRIESHVTGTILTTNPTASIVTSPGPITAASRPALINLPTLAISTVAGVSAPANPGGSYTTADVTLPGGTANPVSVVTAETNTPVPGSPATTVWMKVLPQFAAPTTTSTTTLTGTFANSTATNSVTLPNGAISVLQGYSAMFLP